MKSRVAISSFLALIFISLILRPPIAAIGPLLHEITEGLSLDSSQVSLLTAVPVFCFGLGAFLSPVLVRRFGLNAGMLLVLVTLFMALVLRQWFGYSSMLVGTIFVGLAIAIANVLLPTLVRKDFKERASLMTSVYTTLLALSASLMAGFAVILSDSLGGWQWVLLLTAAPAAFAILFWLPRFRSGQSHIRVTAQSAKSESRAVYQSPIAWAILGYFGLQSLGFYVVLGWLPTILIDASLTPEAAGAFLGLATAIGIPSGLALAPVISKLKSLSLLAVLASALTAAGFALIAWLVANDNVNNQILLVTAAALIAFGQSANFPISLSLIATRASTQAQTTTLSAFSQGWGYLIAGAGTFAFGAIGSHMPSWSVVLFAIAMLTVGQMVLAAFAGRNRKIAEQ
ncbi:MAG: MFS transporter [Rhodoluna sp.]|nr:MFS transporter [Rhodoluna sp.]MBP6186147.1 MFS transporter [Rhodoluna sp.]